jgi:peptidoglycan hydrolase-like protein with peptidoglycan-binding domain
MPDGSWIQPTGAGNSFVAPLRIGVKNQDVTKLQIFLARDPSLYPEGLVTGYFGPLTKQAVIRFQEKYTDEILKPLALSHGTGFVGSATLKKLNELVK